MVIEPLRTIRRVRTLCPRCAPALPAELEQALGAARAASETPLATTPATASPLSPPDQTRLGPPFLNAIDTDAVSKQQKVLAAAAVGSQDIRTVMAGKATMTPSKTQTPAASSGSAEEETTQTILASYDGAGSGTATKKRKARP